MKIKKKTEKKLIINSNTKILDQIDQIFHNFGVSKNLRHSEIIKIVLAKIYKESNFNDYDFFIENNADKTSNNIKQLYKKSLIQYNFNLNDEIQSSSEIIYKIAEVLNSIKLSNELSLSQDILMKFGPQFLKMDLDQYFTPREITDFISSIIIADSSRKIIDPAGGSGDFLMSFFSKIKNSKKASNIYYQDSSMDAMNVAKLNSIFHSATDLNLKVGDSILDFNSLNNYFDYCLTNPPFGNKTLWELDIDIMENYILGHKFEKENFTGKIFKQQLGILFIERSLRYVKDNGIVIIILPNGYLTNPSEKYIRSYLLENYKIIGVIELPSGAFKKSGTGVSSVILIVQKTKATEDYEIFTDIAIRIGFDFNSKLNEKVYRRNPVNGEYLLNQKSELILDNDLDIIKDKFYYFAYKNNLANLNHSKEIQNYNFVRKSQILKDDDLVISPKRYSDSYLNTIKKLKNENAKSLKEIGCTVDRKIHEIEHRKMYSYLDIGQIGRFNYNKDNLIVGWNLPGRAKYLAKKGDLFVSKLNSSSIKFCYIYEDDDNIIVSNGLFKLKFEDEKQKFNFIHFLFSKDFAYQFKSLSTGSIMDDVKSEDFLNKILIPQTNLEENSDKIRKLIELNIDLSKLY
jgi:type I restriction enzyme M protein